MPIEILKEEYEILELLTNGERLFGVRPGLQYEFISRNGTRTQAECLTVVNLIRKTVLKPSDDGPELLFQGNLSDFSISKVESSKPRPRGKQIWNGIKRDPGTMSSILVVEDEDYIQTFIKEVLEPQGQVVVTTSSAKEALRLCQQQSFDLVITDLWMPDMDGLELIRTLRQSHPKLPILAISGRSDTLLKMSTALGAVGTLQKPFKPRDLLAGVDKVLGKQPA